MLPTLGMSSSPNSFKDYAQRFPKIKILTNHDCSQHILVWYQYTVLSSFNTSTLHLSHTLPKILLFSDISCKCIMYYHVMTLKGVAKNSELWCKRHFRKQYNKRCKCPLLEVSSLPEWSTHFYKYQGMQMLKEHHGNYKFSHNASHARTHSLSSLLPHYSCDCI